MTEEAGSGGDEVDGLFGGEKTGLSVMRETSRDVPVAPKVVAETVGYVFTLRDESNVRGRVRTNRII